VHDLLTKGLGFQLSFGSQLQLLVNTYHVQSVENSIANHLVQEIVHGIVRTVICAQIRTCRRPLILEDS
jgi:hypothetical protein